MRHGKIRPPSPAMVVSMAALFVALGGVGYAAVTLPRGSVGAAQLRTGAVTETKIAAGAVRSFKIRTNAISSTKVAHNSLTGADILESSLGAVPKVTGLSNTPLTRAAATAGANDALLGREERNARGPGRSGPVRRGRRLPVRRVVAG